MWFGELKVRVIDRWDMDGVVDIYILHYEGRGKTSLIQIKDNRLIIEEIKEGFQYQLDAKPTMQLPKEALKGLVQGIAEMGILPDQVKESESLLKLKDDHLQDMRKLVGVKR